MDRRKERVNDLIQEEVSKLIHQEVEFSLGVLVTVTEARVSVDFAHTKVYISVLPKGNTGSVLEVLRKNIYRLQQILNKKLRVKPVPKIAFIIDKREDNAEKVENIIKNI